MRDCADPDGGMSEYMLGEMLHEFSRNVLQIDNLRFDS